MYSESLSDSWHCSQLFIHEYIVNHIGTCPGLEARRKEDVCVVYL